MNNNNKNIYMQKIFSEIYILFILKLELIVLFKLTLLNDIFIGIVF